MRAASVVAFSHLLRSRLCRRYLGEFALIWVLVKLANGAVAARLGLAPLGFRPGTEALACAIELLVLASFIRRTGEDILLANLGWPLPAALAALVPVHVGLSLAASLAA